MKVSIVIPAYNEEHQIEATLRAALRQDYRDFEIIVVDNASIDQTSAVVQKIIAEQKDLTKLKLVYEPNKGTQWARERGRKESHGEIIVNLDADCLPETDWLSKGVVLLTAHDPHKNIVTVTGPYDYYDAKPFFRTFSLFAQRFFYPMMHYALNFFHKGGIIIEGNAFYTASVLKKVGGYNTFFTFYGDGADLAKKISPIGYMLYDRNFILKTSARRFQKYGSVKISALYIYNFFKAHYGFKKNPLKSKSRTHI